MSNPTKSDLSLDTGPEKAPALDAAKDAAEAEAKNEDVITFEFEDHKYTYDRNIVETDSDIMEAFEENKVIVPLKLLLGDQYALFKSRGKNGKRSLPEIQKLTEALFEAQGVKTGESSG